MNRRRTITIAGTVGAVAGFMGVVYGTANWATSQREGPGSPAGPNPAQALRAGRAPIPEVAVAPGTGSGPAPVVPPFPKGEPGGDCVYPICFISGNLELPAPHVVADLECVRSDGGTEPGQPVGVRVPLS